MANTQQTGQMDRPVSFDAMIRYVGTQVENLARQLTTVSSQLDRHEEWHTSDLQRQLADRRRSGLSGWGLAIQSLSALAALAAVVVAIVALTHGGG